MAINSEDSPDSRLNFNMPNSADQHFNSDDNFKGKYPVVFTPGHDLEGKQN